MQPINVSCTHHSNNLALYRCRPCDAVLCGECVDNTGQGTRGAVQCKQCQALLEPLEARSKSSINTAAELGVHTPLWNRLPDIFGYLREPSVLFGMLGLAVVVPLLRLFSWVPFLGIVLALFAFGIEAATFFRILETSAYGEKELDPPDVSNIGDVIAGPVIWYIACVVPALSSLLFIGWSAVVAIGMGMPPWEIFEGLGWPVFVFVFGVVMMPLFFAIAAIGRSVFAIYNPNHWIDSIKLMKWDYAFGAGLFYALLLVEFLLILPLLGLVETYLSFPLVTTVFVSFVAYMARAVRFRAIGVMCEPYMDRGHDAPRAATVEPEVPVARVVNRSRDREDAADVAGAAPTSARSGSTSSPVAVAASSVAAAAVGAAATAPARRQRLTEAPDLSSRGAAVTVGGSEAAAPLRDALQANDHAAVRSCASGALEALSREQSAGQEIADLYRTAIAAVEDLELSDRALVAVVTAADKVGDAKLLVFATRKLLAAFPNSAFVPRALWLTASAQEQAGRPDLMEKSLRKLIDVAPFDPFSDQARKKLDGHWKQ